MIEAVMIWNEPNNKSHWDFEIDPDWARFAEMARLAGQAIAAENPALAAGARRHLADRSRLHPATWRAQGVLDQVDAVAVHGFPLDWNHWQIDEWPAKLAEIRAGDRTCRSGSPRSASRPSAPRRCRSSGLRRTAELLIGRAPRIHWYSLYDLPRAWPATTRHREAEGSSYYRHFYMGLLREDGTPKLALPPLPRAHARRSASASGSTSRITGSTTPSRWLQASSACATCARACAGPTASAPTRSTGSTGRCRRWSSST